MSHSFFDGMPNCRARKEAIRDLIEKDQAIFYYLNFGRYHSRWKELGEADFQSDLTRPRGTYYNDRIERNWEIPVIPPDEKEEIDGEMFRYLQMLVELCRENDVELIFYVAPFNAQYANDEITLEHLYRRQRMFNWLSDYAALEGIPYHNLFYELEEIGLQYDHDFMDSQHLNCYGQEKLTRYMAEKGYFK